VVPLAGERNRRVLRILLAVAGFLLVFTIVYVACHGR
jgi:hypothetical protein